MSGFLGCLVFFLAVASSAQTPSQPAVTFTLDFPGSEPGHYVIRAASDCKASYESDGKLNQDSEENTFRLEFTLSEPTCSSVVALTKRAGYFAKELDSGKKNLAFTGTKILAYENGTKSTRQSYNYSPNSAVQELTSLFQNVSSTLEFGHRLEYYHRYQKLALSEELTRMEDRAKQNSLIEVKAIAPILQQIAADQTVINPVRSRAQRLLAASN